MKAAVLALFSPFLAAHDTVLSVAWLEGAEKGDQKTKVTPFLRFWEQSGSFGVQVVGSPMED